MLERIVRRTVNKSVMFSLVTMLNCSVQVPSKCTFESDKNTPACQSYQNTFGYDTSVISTKDSIGESVDSQLATQDIVPEESNLPSIYTKVSLAIPSVTVEIKGLNPIWGKIVSIDYTIKNNQESAVKPNYILISQIEGYDNKYFKKIPLSLTTKIIDSGKSFSSNCIIPTGFTYSEATAGKVEDVTIAFMLFDEKDIPMASYAKDYDLSGK